MERGGILYRPSWLWIWLLLWLAVGSILPLGAESVPEGDAQALLLLQFAKVTRWPADKFPGSSSPIIIGALGKNPIFNTLTPLKGDIVEGQPVVVNDFIAQGRQVVVEQFSSVKEARSAHVLWISSTEDKRIPGILQELQGSSVLTVSDFEGFANDGGMIEIFVRDKRTHFKIDNTSAQQQQLQVSSQLLKLADWVK